ncbi:unnamed protein product [Phytophthora lilii]|uniref:Unnamed protein product n=1 Tax=Phytophthora lilii TaxID=2077276 RepID=A0A9W6YKY8_9STRA|nr:unnamed protein product [Phytophthora lilii]
MLFVDSVKGQLRYNFDRPIDIDNNFRIFWGELIYTFTMAGFVKLDSTNLVQDGYNSTWKYSFPGSAADFKDVACAVQSISMYNSEYDIDATQFSNNSFKIDVPTAGTTSTVSVILPDGLYSYSDTNRSIQTALVNAGAYLINPSGENGFYIQLTENSVYYAAQFDFSATPTTLPTAGGTWTRPASGPYSSGGTGLPTTTRVPRLIIDNASFGSWYVFFSVCNGFKCSAIKYYPTNSSNVQLHCSM